MTEEERQRIERGTPLSPWVRILGGGLVVLAVVALVAAVLGVVLS